MQFTLERPLKKHLLIGEQNWNQIKDKLNIYYHKLYFKYSSVIQLVILIKNNSDSNTWYFVLIYHHSEKLCPMNIEYDY